MINIGWASLDFTPDRPAMLQGQMHVRVATSAKDPLTVTCMAVEGEDGVGSLFICADICGVRGELLARVRELLSASVPAVPAERIVMNVTHTHDSLVMTDGFYEHPGGDVMTAAECAELVATRAAQAATQAWAARKPHSIAAAYGHAVVGHNRRPAYADGSTIMYGPTNREDFAWIEGHADHSLNMLFTWNESGELDGIIVNIACPSQVEEHLHEFSADFWHEVRVELRRRFGDGIFVLPQCAPAGDLSPHPQLDKKQEALMRERRGISERQEIALRIADAVSRALECTEPESGPTPLQHRTLKLELAPREVSQPEAQVAQKIHDSYVASRSKDDWWPSHLRQVIAQYQGGYQPAPVAIEAHVVRLGDIVIATNPFELFVDYGCRIKERSRAAQTFLVQLTNGAQGYLPTERAVRGGSYGAMPSSCLASPKGAQQLVEATVQTINELFPDATH